MNSKHYGPVILPGGSLNPDGTLKDTAKIRLDEARSLYAQRIVDNLIVCGSHSYKFDGQPIVTEAGAYAAYLRTINVPGNKIFKENDSRDSLGNFLFTKTKILMTHGWRSVLVIPTYNQSPERRGYLLQKVLGNEYLWDIIRVGESKEPENLAREAKSLLMTKEINDKYADGDHGAIYKGLLETHPGYGGNRWTIDELKRELGQ